MPDGMRCLDPSIAQKITELSRAQSNDKVYEAFGFSYNTLKKLEVGLPLRKSLADRIEERAMKFFHAADIHNIVV